jgi:aryl-alcohol dehydrogenase-like predicted oxidoreductase
MTITRRDYLKLSLAAGACMALPSSLLWASTRGALITRPIPSSGEQVPVVGLGSSATFAAVARSEDVSALREVMSAMLENGGTIFDTAPGYGASEQVAGDIARELGVTDKVFWATKVNVAPRGGGSADPAAARAQLEDSFKRLGTNVIDLIQVHNMGDVPVHLGLLKELKEAGRVRYIGVTTTNPDQYDALVALMRRERLDFIGIDYAIDNRTVEQAVLPTAAERGTGVLVYAPFGRTRLWERVRGKEVPAWASEFDATSWGQFFLKFVIANQAVTAATPATSRPHNMIDNMGGAHGRLPDAAMLKRMIAHIEAL